MWAFTIALATHGMLLEAVNLKLLDNQKRESVSLHHPHVVCVGLQRQRAAGSCTPPIATRV